MVFPASFTKYTTPPVMHLIPLLTLPISLPPFAPDHQPSRKAPPPFVRPQPCPVYPATTRYQGSIKAKTPAIVPHQGISRHGMKLVMRPSGSHPPMWSAATCRRTPQSCHQRHRKFRTPVGSIKLPSRLKPQQSRLIVPNQASSRHPMKKLIPSSPRASVAVECGGMPPLWHWETCIPVPCPDLPAHSQPSRHPTRIPKSGFQSRLLYSIKPQSRQKTQQSCLIKANQGIL